MSANTMNRLAGIFVALSVLLLGAAALFRLAQQPKFQLKRVEVRGDLRHVTATSVRTALAGRLRGNYFTMRLEDTRRMFETVPWVAAASVRRVWPDGLLVTLTEHRALGVWGDGRLLSDRGELFVANPDEAEVYGQLPEFSGPVSAAKDAARRYYELSAQFSPLALHIAGIGISDRRAWSLRLAPDRPEDSKQANNLHIELGRDRAELPLAERVAQVIAAYPLIVAQMGGVPMRIDARYPNGLAASSATKAMKSERTVRP
jgi:cell division protein FtsQ